MKDQTLEAIEIIELTDAEISTIQGGAVINPNMVGYFPYGIPHPEIYKKAQPMTPSIPQGIPQRLPQARY